MPSYSYKMLSHKYTQGDIFQKLGYNYEMVNHKLAIVFLNY